MKELKGVSNKIIEIDLSNESYQIGTISNHDYKMYLGGKGLGLKLLYDRMPSGVDPMGPENMIAFTCGPLIGTGAPCTGRFSAITKSPLTGIMAHSSCGGPFGQDLRTAGWDGLIVKGKAKSPVYIIVTSEGVEFKDASHLWGKDPVESQELLGDKGNTVVIGQAGENLVKVSNIVSGHRFFGRCGMGAVMGGKNLKAIVAIGGTYKIIPENRKLFEKSQKKAAKYIKSNHFTSGSYRKYGTPAHVTFHNNAGTLSVRNFTLGKHADAHKISGEEIEKKFQTKPSTCRHCMIMCGKKGIFANKERRVPEYETLAVLGANLGVFDPEIISDWNELCAKFGMDTISVGNIIGWAMEATEKGLIDTDLKFGSPKEVDRTIEDMAVGRGFGNELARGVKRLSEKYGGKEFAIHVKGLEFSAYDPRGCFGQGLSYAVANRGACHLSGPTQFMEVMNKTLNPYATKAKPEFVKFFEDLTNCVNSISICIFTSIAFPQEVPMAKYTHDKMLYLLMQYIPKIAVNLIDYRLYVELWSAVTGIKISSSDFIKAGERIHLLERYMNTREGISRKDDILPDRFLNEGRDCDPKKRTVPLHKMLDKYYKQRGFDQNGIPTDNKLLSMGISH